MPGSKGRARAFVEIQQGCDHRCTFCIIPFGRGNNRSVPIGVIVEQVRLLVAEGYREIVLTGVDITDYGKDLPARPRLGEMIKRLLTLVPELPRLRLSSVDPAEIDDALFDIIAHEPRLMPHFHISVQAGDDLILKAHEAPPQPGRYPEAFVGKVRASRRPDAAFGADIIAGFPTESDAAFANSVSLVEDLPTDLATCVSRIPNAPAPRRPRCRNCPATSVKSARPPNFGRRAPCRSPGFLDAQVGATADGAGREGFRRGRGRAARRISLPVRIEGALPRPALSSRRESSPVTTTL